MCPASYQALHAHTERVCLCFIYHGSNYQQSCDKAAVSAMELYKTDCYFTDWKTDVSSLCLSRSRNESMLEKYGIFSAGSLLWAEMNMDLHVTIQS